MMCDKNSSFIHRREMPWYVCTSVCARVCACVFFCYHSFVSLFASCQTDYISNKHKTSFTDYDDDEVL